MSAHLRFFAALDRLQRLDTHIMAGALGRFGPEFLRRRWITESGHLTHVMVPFLDSQQEVEVEVDVEAAVYRYPSPQQRSRMVTEPLAEIALYTLQMDAWLDDLVALIGIEDRRRSTRRIRVPDHLWHLGEARIAGTHDFAPVFVARAWKRAPETDVTTVLEDAIWARGGVVLGRQPSPTAALPRDHAMRCLDEFVRMGDGKEVFDVTAFDRVLRGHVTPRGVPEPDQFLQGNRLRLPHFTESRELPEKQAKIIKQMWGFEGKPAPEMSWADVKAKVVTGYQSFDDAFGGKVQREDILEKRPQRGKYRVRRNP